MAWVTLVIANPVWRRPFRRQRAVAYKTIANAASDEAITLAFWSHLRRRYFDLAESGPAPIAALYAIEKTIRGRSADERLNRRRGATTRDGT